MVVIDCHAHLSDSSFNSDLDQVVKTCRDEDIYVVTMGMTYNDFGRVLEISRTYDNVLFGLGLHPIQPGRDEKRPLMISDTDELDSWLSEHHAECICLGECGLDFSRWLCPTSAERDAQREALVEQIRLGEKYNLPLNLHSRSAGKPLLALLKEHKVQGALLHAFDGGIKAIREGVAQGHYFSVAPSVVRDSSQQLVVRSVPLDRIVLESDSPALGPVPGQRNSPGNLSLVLDTLAKLFDMDTSEVAKVTSENALRLFPKLKTRLRI